MEFSSILGYVITLLIATGAGFAAELLRRMIGIEGLKRISWQLDQKKDLALLAVQYAQQAYRKCSGTERYNHAAEWLAARAKEHGITITADEVKGLIEATLRQIKDTLGEEWANLIKADENKPAEEAG